MIKRLVKVANTLMVCDFHFNDDIDGTAMADEEANQALDAADHPGKFQLL